MASNDSTAVQVNKSGGTAGANQTLNFTAMTWNTAQTVTSDNADARTETATLMHTAAGGDYTGLAGVNLPVSVTDLDTGMVNRGGADGDGGAHEHVHGSVGSAAGGAGDGARQSS